MGPSLTALRARGVGWRPLLERSLADLASGGVELNAIWESPDERLASLERLERLLDLVVTWNARVDLTAARNERELVDLYLADALVLAAQSARAREPRAWIDVGSGAGAPGLVLASLRSDLALTLVEPRAKRVAFLRTAIGSLDLPRPPRVIDKRSSAVSAASCDVAVSRATFAPDAWLAEGARLARHGVWVLLARADEPARAGWCVARHIDYRWPLTGATRRALLFVPKQPAREATPPSESGASAGVGAGVRSGVQ